jgi:accessory gene regulator B
MNYISDILTNEYASLTNATSDKREIYGYGLRLLIGDIISFSLVLAVSILIGALPSGVIFLSVLCVVRRFSGGYHAETKRMCRASMILTFLIVYLSTKHMASVGAAIALDVLSFAAITGFAPIGHPNKPLTELSIKTNKRLAIIATGLFATLSVVLLVFGRNEGTIISLTLTAVVVLLFIGIIKNQPLLKENNYVTKNTKFPA